MPLILGTVFRFLAPALAGWGLKDIFTPSTKTSGVSVAAVVVGVATIVYFLIIKKK